MRVTLLGELFPLTGSERSSLVDLLQLTVNRRVDLLTTPEAYESLVLACERFGELKDVYLQALRDSESRQATSPSTFQVWVGRPKAPTRHGLTEITVTLADAAQLGAHALRVLCEDETSDGAFLSAVVPPTLRARWREVIDQRLLVPVSAGGVTNVPRRLTPLKDDAVGAARTFVLIDSDAPGPWRAPGAPASASFGELPEATLKAARAAQDVPVAVEVLERRMAENYIPPEALERWCEGLSPREKVDKRPHVEAFVRLPPERQKFHHLKSSWTLDEQGALINCEKKDTKPRGGSLRNDLWTAFKLPITDAELRDYGVYDELAPLFQTLLGLV
jgi:hypothetical protein